MMAFVRFEILQIVNRLASDKSVKSCSLYSSKRISLPILASNAQTAQSRGRLSYESDQCPQRIEQQTLDIL